MSAGALELPFLVLSSAIGVQTVLSPSTIFSLIPSFWEFGSLLGITPWGVLITLTSFNIYSSPDAKY